MPETYGAHECRVYYVTESTYGQTPTNPSMHQIPTESIDAGIDPELILLRGTGSRDLAAVKLGVRKPVLKLTFFLPGVNRTTFIQKALSLDSLSMQVLYYKGNFDSATDIISLLYKGMRIDKLTVECSVEELSLIHI